MAQSFFPERKRLWRKIVWPDAKDFDFYMVLPGVCPMFIMSRKLQANILTRQLLRIMLFVVFLFTPSLLGYAWPSPAGTTAALVVVTANLLLTLWEYRSRWHYSIDKIGIFLVTGSSKYPARRRLLTWAKGRLDSADISHWHGLPSVELKPSTGNPIILVVEASETHDVLEKVLLFSQCSSEK